MWVGVAAYIIFAAATARERRAVRKVNSLTIIIADSSSQGRLVHTSQVRDWLAKGGLKTLGAQVDAVNLAGIEELISRNGFVSRVKAFITYAGELRIRISQRKPVVRLRVDGFDSYVTSDGYVFPAPHASSVYVPVVTGACRLPFSSDYAGLVRRSIESQLRQVEHEISQIDKQKYPFYQRERENDENIRALRRMRVKKGWFEGEQSYDERLKQMREKKEVLRRSYRYQERLIEQGIAGVERKQEDQRNVQKKLGKNYEDFTKLITFVEFIEDDNFWSSEVVQINASTSVSGSLEVELVPRSGDHIVLFGRLEDVEQKLDRLLRFYHGGLNRIGWDKYRTIDVRYAGQVVCRKYNEIK